VEAGIDGDAEAAKSGESAEIFGTLRMRRLLGLLGLLGLRVEGWSLLLRGMGL